VGGRRDEPPRGGAPADAEVERCRRDVRMRTVIDRTSGIQRLMVGREMLGEAEFV
jgi:alkylation response protein AidB-like acyl-CoA dehydrogenase